MDLAESIVELSRVAEGRRRARAELEEATARVAAAIRKGLRTGDEVTIGWEPKGTTLVNKLATYRVEKVTWKVNHAVSGSLRHPRGAVALVRNGAVLEDVRTSATFDGNEWKPSDSPSMEAMPRSDIDQTDKRRHLATMEERMAFVPEAPAVVAAFRELLEKQAREYEEVADEVAKTVIR